MHVLVINSGSSSVKYQVIDPDQAKVLVHDKVERVGEALTHEQALAQVFERVKQHDIAAVGHRVVHGGDKFFDAVVIDDDVVAQIEACITLAPLHNPPNLAGIRAARAALPGVPQGR